MRYYGVDCLSKKQCGQLTHCEPCYLRATSEECVAYIGCVWDINVCRSQLEKCDGLSAVDCDAVSYCLHDGSNCKTCETYSVDRETCIKTDKCTFVDEMCRPCNRYNLVECRSTPGCVIDDINDVCVSCGSIASGSCEALDECTLLIHTGLCVWDYCFGLSEEDCQLKANYPCGWDPTNSSCEPCKNIATADCDDAYGCGLDGSSQCLPLQDLTSGECTSTTVNVFHAGECTYCELVDINTCTSLSRCFVFNNLCQYNTCITHATQAACLQDQYCGWEDGVGCFPCNSYDDTECHKVSGCFYINYECMPCFLMRFDNCSLSGNC